MTQDHNLAISNQTIPIKDILGPFLGLFDPVLGQKYQKVNGFDLRTHIPWTNWLSRVEKYWSHPLGNSKNIISVQQTCAGPYRPSCHASDSKIPPGDSISCLQSFIGWMIQIQWLGISKVTSQPLNGQAFLFSYFESKVQKLLWNVFNQIDSLEIIPFCNLFDSLEIIQIYNLKNITCFWTFYLSFWRRAWSSSKSQPWDWLLSIVILRRSYSYLDFIHKRHFT